jgi:hypothetical protein
VREKEVKIKKKKAFSSNSSSSVAVQLTHGCVDLIEQGTICKEREREFWVEREREKKRGRVREGSKRIGREVERGQLPAAREKSQRKTRHSSLLSLFLVLSVHLEAKHPELVRRRVEIRVQWHLLLLVLLLVEVLLVRVREGRRRVRQGLILVFRSKRKKRGRRVSKKRLFSFSQFVALRPSFSFFCLRAEEIIRPVDQREKELVDAGG